MTDTTVEFKQDEATEKKVVFKPVKLAESELKKLNSPWDAERLAEKRFGTVNAEVAPQEPDKPAAVETESPRIVKHRRDGGLWMEMEFDPGNEGYRRDPSVPRVSMTLVLKKDQVVQIDLNAEQFAQFGEEMSRITSELAVAVKRFGKWQAKKAVFEDAKVAWGDALQHARDEAEADWYIAHPDAEDDEDY